MSEFTVCVRVHSVWPSSQCVSECVHVHSVSEFTVYVRVCPCSQCVCPSISECPPRLGCPYHEGRLLLPPPAITTCCCVRAPTPHTHMYIYLADPTCYCGAGCWCVLTGAAVPALALVNTTGNTLPSAPTILHHIPPNSHRYQGTRDKVNTSWPAGQSRMIRPSSNQPVT